VAAIGGDGVDSRHKRGEEKTTKQTRDREHYAARHSLLNAEINHVAEQRQREKRKVEKSRKLSVKERGIEQSNGFVSGRFDMWVWARGMSP